MGSPAAAIRGSLFDNVALAKQQGGVSGDSQRRAVTSSDPLIQFVLNAPKATEPMSPEGLRALERHLQKSTSQRA